MRWQGKEGSKNVDDRRGRGVKRGAAGVGIGTIILALVYMLLGEDPQQILNQAQQSQPQYEQQTQAGGQDDELKQFVSVVLKQTEEVWNKLFIEQAGQQYQEPILVVYSGQVSSACGHASAATGPFYCPGDYKLYIDLSFYQELKTKFQAPGDFAMAYVVAHEVAHHVQNLLGITAYVDKQRNQLSKADFNQLSVRLELQADFFAGIWVHHAQQMNNILEKGDIEEALNAAHAIGDDRLQKKSQGYIVPDAFTHGTSEQRVRWFTKGVKSGKMDDGDTFGIAYRNL
ncbi:MAG: putative metalloprotease [Saprospiraceae bacterium]|jgi:predicted metalloprotease